MKAGGPVQAVAQCAPRVRGAFGPVVQSPSALCHPERQRRILAPLRVNSARSAQRGISVPFTLSLPKGGGTREGLVPTCPPQADYATTPRPLIRPPALLSAASVYPEPAEWAFLGGSSGTTCRRTNVSRETFLVCGVNG